MMNGSQKGAVCKSMESGPIGTIARRRISYTDRVSNAEVRNRTQHAIGCHEDLLTTVNRRNLKWYGHVSLSSSLAKTILQDAVRGALRWRRQNEAMGRQCQRLDRTGLSSHRGLSRQLVAR